MLCRATCCLCLPFRVDGGTWTWTWRSLIRSEVRVRACWRLSDRMLCLVVVLHVLLLSLCLSVALWIVYLLLLGQLSPKHKRSCKQVNDGMFLPVLPHSSMTPPPPLISHGGVLKYMSRDQEQTAVHSSACSRHAERVQSCLFDLDSVLILLFSFSLLEAESYRLVKARACMQNQHLVNS